MSNPSENRGVYSSAARHFHWLVALMVIGMIPTGIYMVERGKQTSFDALTNILYDSHKLGGFILIWIMVARLAYRLRKGAPASEPTLAPWERAVSHATHWAIYGLLFLVPMLGWLGVSRYPALSIHGWFSLPSIATANEAAAKEVFALHKLFAILLGALVLAHIGAAFRHHFIKRDGVLRRMMPSLPPR
jgi:cytochrome b561